ncbi:MAG: hypothetical protein V4725_00615 [Bacteroidota bacterium]|nr:hypothetical protein [Ferruginibacter sp.]
MSKVLQTVLMCSLAVIIFSCSKKSQPTRATIETSETTSTDTIAMVKKVDSVAVVRKAPVRRKAAAAIPKVITVNDQAAKKSVDGRLYYDLQGRRYWRNYKDGKYYLYNKSMNTDEAFKKPN